jgi:hypothetical protein
MNVEQMRGALTAAVTASSPFFAIRGLQLSSSCQALPVLSISVACRVLAVSAIPNL